MNDADDRLRVRLAALGIVGVVVPLLVLLAVAAWTTEEARIAPDGSEIIERGELSAWIPITVAVLTLPAAAVAWWWAGREVRLHVQAATAIEEQRQLIEDASHHLRTPITVLLANADVTLADPHASAHELRRALETSRATAAGMHATVDDLLGAARSRRLDAVRSETDVVAIAARACAPHTEHASSRGVSLRRTGPGRLTASVDAAALERAIDAIVDNAVRYAPSGSDVLVAVSGDDRVVTVSIADDGPGIGDDQRPHLFERYWSTDPAHTGIGLDVVATAAHGSFEVAVESPRTDSGGTRLVLTIPRRRSVDGAPRPDRSIGPTARPHDAAPRARSNGCAS